MEKRYRGVFDNQVADLPRKPRVVTFSRSITVPLTRRCHNRCDYCSFRVDTDDYLSRTAILNVLEQGKSSGCREVLIMSGERPWLEEGFPLGEQEYIELVYRTCLNALRLGFLPHTNIGVLTLPQLRRLKEVNASMGLMLETSNPNLACHRARPSKIPDQRIAHIENAGRLGIPFTTGILVGIGESKEDRREALQIIKSLDDRYGHIQEVIIQNFKPGSGTPMQYCAEPGFPDLEEAVRYAREIMPAMNIQVPPNLIPRYCELIALGANDLGGVSPGIDYINPRHRWQSVDELSRALGERGYTLQERLPVYPEVNADLSAAADSLRRELVGDIVTYVVNRNINFTNICTGNCLFCAFHRHLGDRDSYLLDIPQIMEKVEDAILHDATEVCIQGGLHPQLTFQFYTGLLAAIKKRRPELHVHAFSPMEIWMIAQRNSMPVTEVLLALKDSGLDSMPGTAAEILVDDIRRKICPDKLSTSQWVEVITCAHKLGIRTSATMMFGHIETWQERIQHMEVIRNIQLETGGFTEFVLLPFVARNTAIARLYNVGSILLEEILKVTAYARLFFGKDLLNIQSSWPKIGVEGVKRSLCCGANDFGGTLIEENVSRCAGSAYGQFLSRQQIEEAIRSIGRVPAERDTVYRILCVDGEKVQNAESGHRAGADSLPARNISSP